jgi:hypothetical protein
MTAKQAKRSREKKDDRPGCLGRLLIALGLGPRAAPEVELPYRLHREFLSPAEYGLYRALHSAVHDWAIICPKVGLGDLFYPKTGDRAENARYRNRIAQKHVDFLLCDRQGMRPLVGVELDDVSHQQQRRQERDAFVDQVFEAAGLPLHRVRAAASYDVAQLSTVLREAAGLPAAPPQPAERRELPVAYRPSPAPEPAAPQCPKCGRPMVVRTVKQQGPHFGKEFWGCPDFPRCRGVRER